MLARPRGPSLLVLALVFTLVAASSRAQDAQDEGRRTLGRFPENLARNLGGLFDQEAVRPFIVGGLATGASFAFDDEVRDAVANPGTGFGRFMDKAGGTLATSLFVGGLFIAGRVADNQRFRAVTYDMAGASIVTAGLTAAFKFTVHRTRPDGSDNRSFPSGHTSAAFALASVAEQHYGWKVGAAAYAATTAMGASRLMEDKHYLSDVVAGATIGYMVGAATVRVNSEPLPVTAAPVAVWSVSPVLGPHARGVTVSVVF